MRAHHTCAHILFEFKKLKMDGVREQLPAVSSSLLPPPTWKEKYQFNPKIDLGIGEWMGEGPDTIPSDHGTLAAEPEATVEENSVLDKDHDKGSENMPPGMLQESRKRKNLSLKKEVLKKKRSALESSERFSTVCENQVSKASRGVIPINTETSTRWAVKNFTDWANNLNKSCSNDTVPIDLLECHDVTKVCKYMCKYILETRKSDGTKYPPGTIKSLIAGINRQLQLNKVPFSIFDRANVQCRDVCNTLDVVCSDLHKDGFGADRNSAPVIAVEDEKRFWEMGTLGYDSPKDLQNAVFFYVGLHFTLRGVQEQYDLLPRQFDRSPPDVSVYNKCVYYQYTEFISKNNQHKFKDYESGKVSRAYAQIGQECCIVKLLDKYLAKLPPGSPSFYMRPVDKRPVTKSGSWYTKQRVGVNNLKKILPSISAVSMCSTNYTNHSLRATFVTRMFAASVPEKLIAEKSGHRSLKALRSYERTNPNMQMAIDAVIANSK